jgi:HEAT repeat protein
VGIGPEARPRLTALLADSDSGVRYWAAVGLTALEPEAQPAARTLAPRLDDPSPSARLAAAEALCNVGRASAALPVIAEALDHESGWVRLQAAIVLAALGEKARPAAPEMRAAIDANSRGEASLYIRWALAHALDQLGEADR